MGSSSVITPEDVLESLMNDGTIDSLRLKIINQLKANVIPSLYLFVSLCLYRFVLACVILNVVDCSRVVVLNSDLLNSEGT